MQLATKTDELAKLKDTVKRLLYDQMTADDADDQSFRYSRNAPRSSPRTLVGTEHQHHGGHQAYATTAALLFGFSVSTLTALPGIMADLPSAWEYVDTSVNNNRANTSAVGSVNSSGFGSADAGTSLMRTPTDRLKYYAILQTIVISLSAVATAALTLRAYYESTLEGLALRYFVLKLSLVWTLARWFTWVAFCIYLVSSTLLVAETLPTDASLVITSVLLTCTAIIMILAIFVRTESVYYFLRRTSFSHDPFPPGGTEVELKADGSFLGELRADFAQEDEHAVAQLSAVRLPTPGEVEADADELEARIRQLRDADDLEARIRQLRA